MGPAASTTTQSLFPTIIINQLWTSSGSAIPPTISIFRGSTTSTDCSRSGTARQLVFTTQIRILRKRASSRTTSIAKRSAIVVLRRTRSSSPTGTSIPPAHGWCGSCPAAGALPGNLPFSGVPSTRGSRSRPGAGTATRGRPSRQPPSPIFRPVIGRCRVMIHARRAGWKAGRLCFHAGPNGARCTSTASSPSEARPIGRTPRCGRPNSA